MTQAPAIGAEDWRRTSPLSFFVSALTNLRSALLPMAAALVGTKGWDGGLLYILPAVVVGLGLTFFFSWLAWRHFRYRLGDSDIRVERGLFSRTARSVPYERIQDVSLEQGLVPRLFGMFEVKFETGAGGKDEVRIRYATQAEAEALREAVRARKSAEVPAAGATEVIVEEPSRLLFAMDLRRLLTFGLFDFSLVVFAVAGAAAQQVDFLLPFDLWDFKAWLRLLAGPGHWLQELGFAAQMVGAAVALAAFAIIGLVTGLGRTVLRDYGFRLEETPKGLRRRRGLLSRTDVVMPLHRVQALKLTTGIVRRRFGWHGLQVVSLSQDEKAGKDVVVPFGQMEEIAPVVETTGFSLPHDATEWHTSSVNQRNDGMVLAAVPFALLAAAIGGIGSRLDAVPVGAPLLASFGVFLLGSFFVLREWHLWRHRRHALDAGQIFVSDGWLAPRLDVASRIKLQSVEIAQGPLARRRGYADVKFGVAGGSLEMHGVPLESARAIRAAVLESIASVDFSRASFPVRPAGPSIPGGA